MPNQLKNLSSKLSLNQKQNLKSNWENILSKLKGQTRLLAVSKLHSAEAVAYLHSLGQIWFGENYVDEVEEKSHALPDSVRWSFIGTLQSNKIQRLVKVVDEIQTVASEKHARLINHHAELLKKNKFPIFICVNAGDEAQKSGCRFDEIPALRDHILKECPNLELRGIMAIPPIEAPDSLYARLREVASTVGAGDLSVGMSNDLEKALFYGSNCVRIGTDIFGERLKKEEKA